MPRKPRFYLPGIPAHVIQRGNNRQAVFFSEEDYTAYLDWLKEGVEKHGCAIHAYVLMTNHVHLLMTPQTRDAISKTIQIVGCHYVTNVNHVYGRSGTLWEGRHKGCLISSKEYHFFLHALHRNESGSSRDGGVTGGISLVELQVQCDRQGE